MISVKRFQQRLEYVSLKSLEYFLKRLSIKQASDFGAKMISSLPLGVLSRRLKVMEANLKLAFPEASPDWRQETIVKTLETWARFSTEYSHIEEILSDPQRIILENEGVLQDLASWKGPIIFFSAHLGHLQMPAWGIKKTHINRDVYQVYRPRNNPWTNDFFLKLQSHASFFIPKGEHTARALFRVLKNNQAVMLLVDQKDNDGIDVPFFGHPSMTGIALARLAFHFRCPVIPVRCIREPSTVFRVCFESPLVLPTTEQATKDLLIDIHHHFERWITEYPHQYWWFHRRWPKSLYNE